MKFSDGYWQTRPQFAPLYAVQVVDITADENAGTLTVHGATAPVRDRGDTVNCPLLTLTFSAPAEGVIRVRLQHHSGASDPGPHFALKSDTDYRPTITVCDQTATLLAGTLAVEVYRGRPWRLDFVQNGQIITSAGDHACAHMTAADPPSRPRCQLTGERGTRTWTLQQLSVAPGERIYGLGERFGPLVKNGQTVDIWNADGGTASEQAYKNVPFYLSSAGYGVFVDDPGAVSFEVCSEVNSRVQFSVPGQTLDYLVIAGPTPKRVLTRYTALTGRPPAVPAWSLGVWLSTSFTTDYDERTVAGFVDGFAARDLPLSVVHYDCFWMRPFRWCDLAWDDSVFPDPAAQLRRLHARGLRVCVWINPYIAQRSALFAEGASRGFLLKRHDGSVWQWDMWQAGMGLVDFTNPAARDWYVAHLGALLDVGVDAFKTDFGERVPVDDVAWFDGSDPVRMHNYYAQLYNEAVYSLLRTRRGEGQAVVFARAATAGGQSFPVHWGGDCESTYAGLAETLRGGLSLAMSGFAYWSHDIGGFEGTPDATLFKRWLAFGLLSSHSRLHGSNSVRVPWAFDDEAVAVMHRFAHLKMSLMPYLMRLVGEAAGKGWPLLRPLLLEFPDDRATYELDGQYLLGDSLLVAPVLRADGCVDVYVPAGRWTSLLDGSLIEGPGWVRQTHPLDSLPLLVRPGTVLPIGAVDDRPEYDWADGVTLRCFELPDGFEATIEVPGFQAGPATHFVVSRRGAIVRASSRDARHAWRVCVGSHQGVGQGVGVVEVEVES